MRAPERSCSVLGRPIDAAIRQLRVDHERRQIRADRRRMQTVGAVERDVRIAIPRRNPCRRDRQEHAVDVRRRELIRLDRARKVLTAIDRRPRREERRSSADRRDARREQLRRQAQRVAIHLDRRRPLLQHDEQPTALRDLTLRNANAPVIDQRKVGFADGLDGERIAVRRVGQRLHDARQVVDVGKAVADEQDAFAVADQRWRRDATRQAP